VDEAAREREAAVKFTRRGGKDPLVSGAASPFRYIFPNLGHQISKPLSIFRGVQAISNPKQLYDLRIRNITVFINIPSEL
jgi:hypothetical protein